MKREKGEVNSFGGWRRKRIKTSNSLAHGRGQQAMNSVNNKDLAAAPHICDGQHQ